MDRLQLQTYGATYFGNQVPHRSGIQRLLKAGTIGLVAVAVLLGALAGHHVERSYLLRSTPTQASAVHSSIIPLTQTRFPVTMVVPNNAHPQVTETEDGEGASIYSEPNMDLGATTTTTRWLAVPLAFTVLFLVAGTVAKLRQATQVSPQPLLPYSERSSTGQTSRTQLLQLKDSAEATTANPFNIWETLTSIFSGTDPIDIRPVTLDELKPMKDEYIIKDIASLLAREIFRLEEGTDLCRKVADVVESFTLRQYGLAALDSDLEVFVAINRKTGELAGCVFAKKFRTDSKEYAALDARELPLMESLAVDPKYAGRGLGSLLVKKCEKTAKDWGYDRLMLQVYSDNTRAIKFYKKRGYKEVCEDNTIQRPVSSSIFGIRWEEFDHKVMVKQLNSSLPF